jgi:putative transposase
MISFKDAQVPKDVILFAIFFDVRYTVSHRDLEETMAERGVTVDHAQSTGGLRDTHPWLPTAHAAARLKPTDPGGRTKPTSK